MSAPMPQVLMPMTAPRESISGPPELPWLMTASCWMDLVLPTVAPLAKREITPLVTVTSSTPAT